MTSFRYGAGGDRCLHPPHFTFTFYFFWFFVLFCFFSFLLLSVMVFLCRLPPRRSSFPSLHLSSLGLLSHPIQWWCPPANSVCWLSWIVGHLCLSVVSVPRQPNRRLVVSEQSHGNVSAHAHFLGHIMAVILSPLGHVSVRSALCLVGTSPTVSSPVVPRSSLCPVSICLLHLYG